MGLRRMVLPPRAAPAAGTLVLLHGFGADEHDLLPLAHELHPGLRAVSLAAPLSLPWGGRAWFALEQTAEGFGWDPQEVRAAAALAVAAIGEVAREDGAPPLLCGFSQGACIALLAALERPQGVRGVLSLSGVPPDRAGPVTAHAKGLPVFAAHGTLDPLLPISLGRRTRALLEELGCDVSWHEYPMPHSIAAEELADARAWLAALKPWPPPAGG